MDQMQVLPSSRRSHAAPERQQTESERPCQRHLGAIVFANAAQEPPPAKNGHGCFVARPLVLTAPTRTPHTRSAPAPEHHKEINPPLTRAHLTWRTTWGLGSGVRHLPSRLCRSLSSPDVVARQRKVQTRLARQAAARQGAPAALKTLSGTVRGSPRG